MTYGEWKEKYVIEKGVEWKVKSRKNDYADKKQYEIYKKILGKNNLPKTFESFQKIKYNDIEEWGKLKSYKRVIEIGGLTPLATFDFYKKIIEELKNNLIGIIISNDVEIKSFSSHFISRVIGSIEQRRSGVEISDIIETLKNPISIQESKANTEGKLGVKFKGKNNEVTVNIETGNLVQTNPIRKR